MTRSNDKSSPSKLRSKSTARPAKGAAKKKKSARPAAAEAQQVGAPPERVLAPAAVTALVRREAFRRAQQRSFRNGSPLADWVSAEAAVHEALAARGVRLSAGAS